MCEECFSKWSKWEERNKAPDIRNPGIYAIAISEKDIAGDHFQWIHEVVYIGMTNSIAGLKGRLKQFDNTIIGKRGHGGADRVRYKHQDYKKLVNKLFVAIAPFNCDVQSNKPKDLRVMGDVAKFEYDCFAQFVEKFASLPEFNNKKKSKKYSLTIGRSGS